MSGATSALKDIQHYMRPGTLQLPALPPLSLYVHLPWCLKKCPYCDFNSHEFRAAARGAARAALSRRPGRRPGGRAAAGLGPRACTASSSAAARPACFRRRPSTGCWATSARGCRWTPDCEITLEANPGTFEKDRFKAFRSAGVTRLSVGVQSFNDAHLKALGRVHDRAQALAAVEEAAQAFDTFNLDLMYALPGQTLAQLRRRRAHRAGAGAAAPFDLPPDDRAEHRVRQVPAGDSRGRHGLRHARPPDRADRRRRPAALRSLGLCPAGPPLLAQPELLAVWRLPGHRRRRAQQAQFRAPRGAPGALARAARATWTTRWPARP